jgi:osmotically inducible protein OsmC
MNTFYTATATATSGREGCILADEPKLALSLSIPKQLGGAGGEGTNPEQLFAGGYAACFSSALSLVARKKGVSLGEYSMTGHVSLGKLEGNAFGLAVELIGCFPSIPKEQADALMHEAHVVCPYSNAIRGNVEVTLTVED